MCRQRWRRSSQGGPQNVELPEIKRQRIGCARDRCNGLRHPGERRTRLIVGQVEEEAAIACAQSEGVGRPDPSRGVPVTTVQPVITVEPGASDIVSLPWLTNAPDSKLPFVSKLACEDVATPRAAVKKSTCNAVRDFIAESLTIKNQLPVDCVSLRLGLQETARTMLHDPSRNALAIENPQEPKRQAKPVLRNGVKDLRKQAQASVRMFDRPLEGPKPVAAIWTGVHQNAAI